MAPRRKAFMPPRRKASIKKESEKRKLAVRNYLRFLLAPLKKGQLVDLLVEIGVKNPELAEEIRGVLASSEPANRKLFVHGLGLQTSSETLCDAFSSHGAIEEGAVIFDKATGKSRGFGFITFKNVESVQEALQQPSRVIDGRPALCKLSGFGFPFLSADAALKRLYVAGLSPDVSTEMFLSFFEKYGEIEEGSVVYDKETNISRGFGFVTYKTTRGARRAMIDKNKNLGGRKITVKNARAQQKGKEKQTQEEPVTNDHPHTYDSPDAPYGVGVLSEYPTGISGYSDYLTN